MNQKIEKGTIARYTGDDHPGIKGDVVKVLEPILDDDDRPTGRVEVQPWMELEGRYSWVTHDARVEDLQPLPPEHLCRYQRDDPTMLVAGKKYEGPLQ